MKKIFTIYIILFTFSFSALFANEKVNVIATVGPANPNPIITNVIPGDNLILLDLDIIENFKLNIKNTDAARNGESITYTITPDSGSVNKQSGTLSNTTLLQNGTAEISFYHKTPTTNTAYNITVTINDGTNITTKIFNIQVF